MAEEKQFERTYNIPLRKESSKSPDHKKSTKTVIALKSFIRKHSKSENIKVGKYLNEKIHENGRKNMPHHVLVKITKDKDNLVKAELVGAPEEKLVEAVKEKLEKPAEINLDKKLTKQQKEDEIKKEVLEHPDAEKGKEVKDKEELSGEIDEELRKKDIVKRRNKKDMIKT
ncbi:60S ribosomal protein L31 [Candidatus Woesearchaeota archaeon]|nr:60S ribosomal protein L31 [Candidatus Woesearchaeota archaeon]